MAAARAIEVIGQRTVVSGGQVCEAMALSSNPMIECVSGTPMCRARAAWIAPAAISSLEAKIAVGRG